MTGQRPTGLARLICKMVVKAVSICCYMYCCSFTGLLASEEISRLLFADQHCVLSCGQTSGTVTVWDLRAGLVVCELPRALQPVNSCGVNQSHTAWTCDWLSRGGPMSTLLLLASDGQVIIVDVRHGCQNHDVLSLSTGQTFPQASHEHMTIRVSILYISDFLLLEWKVNILCVAKWDNTAQLMLDRQQWRSCIVQWMK